MIHEDRLLKYEFLRLILVLDFYYGFEGQFLENCKKWGRHSTGGIIIFALGDPLRYSLYELRILVNKHVEKGSDFRHRASFWE